LRLVGPVLTDSGGFQMWSLGHLRRLDEEGVTFRSHLDGAEVRLGPEAVVGPAAPPRRRRRHGARRMPGVAGRPRGGGDEPATHQRWAVRAARGMGAAAGPGGLFAIVQGSAFRDLREGAALRALALGFDGYAIGGVSVGERPPSAALASSGRRRLCRRPARDT
jgi:queuine tRNA-ribosyltransferase